uniref:Phospholipase A2 n=1 Tax=Hadrurus spadix TaxID=141984 RepID=A0A1W7R9X4_9SCOR
MAFLCLTALLILISLRNARIIQRELYLNFEPVSNQKDSWPVARAAIVNFDEGFETGREFSECRMLNSIQEIARETVNFPQRTIKRVSKEEMDVLERTCSRPLETERFFIYKGTKWCGPGNIAENEFDLGILEADKCCYVHDHCDSIAAGETKYGLVNNGYYTLLNCDCEESFDRCLKTTADRVEGSEKEDTLKIRHIYFNTIKSKCYRLYCRNRRSGTDNTCLNKTALWKESYHEF